MIFRILFTTTLLFLASFAGAFEPYHATVTVETQSVTVSAPNLVDLDRNLQNKPVEVLGPIYTPVSPVSIDYNLRQILADASFAAGSTELVVVFPNSGNVVTFDGGTRPESLALFKEYLRDGGGNGSILKSYAKFSPIDPVAGNPNSIMAQMAQSDYLLGILSPLSGCDCSWSAQPIVHQFNTGLNVMRAFANKYDTTTVSVPLRYSFSPNLRWAFIIDLPITYYRNGGASTIQTSLGVGLRLPITSNWSLTSTVRMGNAGTLDLCTCGNFVSFGLTSALNYKAFDCVFTLLNYAAYTTSTNLWLSGVNFNYHLQDYIFKNGFTVTTCQGFCLCQRPINFSFSFEDSYFTGHRLYIKHFDEVSAAVITRNILPWLDYDCLSLGFTYRFGERKYKGYMLSMLYQF